MKIKCFLAVLALLALNISAHAHDAHMSPEASADANVFIISPEDGATVPQTFTVKFGASGVAIVPAGTQEENSGHHHLLVDTDTLPNMHAPLPATDKIIHFGKGQTETQLTLPPGKHTLQLLLGNYMHIPQATPVISKKITITVE